MDRIIKKFLLLFFLILNIANATYIDSVSQGDAGTSPWLFNLSTIFGAAPSSTNYIPSRLSDGTSYYKALTYAELISNPLAVTGSFFQATQPVSQVSQPLPTGAATSANQTTANSSLNSIDSKIPSPISGRVPVDGSGVTQPVSQVSQPLPTGAATESTLNSMNNKVPTLGGQSASTSTPIVVSDGLTVTGPPTLSVINTDLLTGTVSGWYDAKSFHSVSIQVIASAGISAGQLTFEQTNDTTNGPNGVPLLIYESGVANANPLSAATSVVVSTAKIFDAPIFSRYIRVRISTAIVGGSVQAVAHFSQLAHYNTRMNIQQTTAANLQATVTGTVTANLGAPTLFGDIASSTITTTTTVSAAQSPGTGSAVEFNVPVTAVSGTLPTLDISIEESDNTGTDWYRIYDFPRITATGIYRTPPIKTSGNRFRYIHTIGGTTPSFTRSLNRVVTARDGESIRQIYDRTIVLTTLNSTTPVLDTAGYKNVTTSLYVLSAGTQPRIRLQGSDDNLNWQDLGSVIVSINGSEVKATTIDIGARFVRAIVTTAGTVVTDPFVFIKAWN